MLYRLGLTLIEYMFISVERYIQSHWLRSYLCWIRKCWQCCLTSLISSLRWEYFNVKALFMQNFLSNKTLKNKQRQRYLKCGSVKVAKALFCEIRNSITIFLRKQQLECFGLIIYWDLWQLFCDINVKNEVLVLKICFKYFSKENLF